MPLCPTELSGPPPCPSLAATWGDRPLPLPRDQGGVSIGPRRAGSYPVHPPMASLASSRCSTKILGPEEPSGTTTWVCGLSPIHCSIILGNSQDVAVDRPVFRSHPVLLGSPHFEGPEVGGVNVLSRAVSKPRYQGEGAGTYWSESGVVGEFQALGVLAPRGRLPATTGSDLEVSWKPVAQGLVHADSWALPRQIWGQGPASCIFNEMPGFAGPLGPVSRSPAWTPAAAHQLVSPMLLSSFPFCKVSFMSTLTHRALARMLGMWRVANTTNSHAANVGNHAEQK